VHVVDEFGDVLAEAGLRLVSLLLRDLLLRERLVDRGRARRRERGDEAVTALARRRVRDRAEARAGQLRLQVRGCDAEVRRALLEQTMKDPLEDIVTIFLAGRVLERLEDRIELVRGAGLRPLRVQRRGGALVREDVGAHRRERGHRSAAEEPEAEDAGRRDRYCLSPEHVLGRLLRGGRFHPPIPTYL